VDERFLYGRSPRGNHWNRSLCRPDNSSDCRHGQDAHSLSEDSGLGAMETKRYISNMVKGLKTLLQKLANVYLLFFNFMLQWVFAVLPPLMTQHRYHVFFVHEAFFLLMFSSGSSWIKTKVTDIVLKSYDVVRDPEVRRKLKPTYQIGCKRATPHQCYAEVK
jgi:hypothetical protein